MGEGGRVRREMGEEVGWKTEREGGRLGEEGGGRVKTEGSGRERDRWEREG